MQFGEIAIQTESKEYGEKQNILRIGDMIEVEKGKISQVQEIIVRF